MSNTNEITTERWSHVRQIAALGEPLLELHPASNNQIHVAFGGDVANTLVCLARLLAKGPVRLTMVTALGGSSYGSWLRGRLTREGIAFREPDVIAGTEPGIYGVPLDPQPGSVFSYWRHQSAARLFLQQATLGDFERLLGSPDLLLVTGITLALCSAESFEALCRWAQTHRAECHIVFDTNYRGALWPSASAAAERIGRFGTFASILATGLEDEQALRQTSRITDIVASLRGSAVELLIRLGPDGCIIDANDRYMQVAAEATTVIDTAGAGDAHLAGYLAARVCGSDPATAAHFANRVAGVIVRQRGSAAALDAKFPPLPGATPGNALS